MPLKSHQLGKQLLTSLTSLQCCLVFLTELSFQACILVFFIVILVGGCAIGFKFPATTWSTFP
jgi:hypothetical protein